MTVTLYIYST